jgi:hypothetical protein
VSKPLYIWEELKSAYCVRYADCLLVLLNVVLCTVLAGQLDAKEIEAGLKELGSFGEVTAQDAAAVVAHFDKDGDKHVSAANPQCFVTMYSLFQLRIRLMSCDAVLCIQLRTHHAACCQHV